MIQTANLGFPRMGLDRELKKATERYWKGKISREDLLLQASELRSRHWQLQKEAGIDMIPSNDFSLYDHVLDTVAMVGAIPDRFHSLAEGDKLELYFAMARGSQKDGVDVVAMEMTKWFDTNYHYIVPEFKKTTAFSLSSLKVVEEFKEALSLGIKTRPVLLSPASFLMLGKAYDDHAPLDLLEKLLPIYKSVLDMLADAGAEWVQLDEPCLGLDLEPEEIDAITRAQQYLAAHSSIKIMLTSYFAPLKENLCQVFSLPVAGLHFDLIRGYEDWKSVIDTPFHGKVVSLGLIDGRNIWRADLEDVLSIVQQAVQKFGPEKVVVAPSCSMLHCPMDLDSEPELDHEIRSWLAFAKQKLAELSLVAAIANHGREQYAGALSEFARIGESRKSSTRIHDLKVKQRANAVQQLDYHRIPFRERVVLQEESLSLPLLPTTSIGSFPQTSSIRQMRARYKKGELSRERYEEFLAEETKQAIRWQESAGIDVLVHGEFERNDMVEYFGEQLNGFAFTKNGWVQSYGSRCVKPPIIYGDVSRPHSMTVRWSSYAQGLTVKPVKGMLTGPVTILQWSFVRNDQERKETCKQIALAIRDEVKDLENNHIQVIQIDEPAFREGLPLRKAEHKDYLDWASQCFRLSSSGVKSTTQIHTHMCYSEFNDIMDAIASLDADVISIETSRSAMELLDAFVSFQYPNQIGPGVYDIHSPRIPSQAEMTKLLSKALEYLDHRQVWVNPDCGLKTRNWDEVKAALTNMVSSARELRQALSSQAKGQPLKQAERVQTH
ncbi:5-methyltetrahydropteroyltriglutamate--homocysteine S-methyltransferase [Pseudobacteriovorax antillogorgiicola]|uniref:5-methyltetrahydropteroyltriglutamate--homocysteine methyltransferase n=1 Tax=Pseudobacteriovorax antillogorgiicola TaxID=1513793 RepID=A0A1Y6BR41_9BACT|nr:5-methyltetrahydropteroyltriglutamate--homocysteine S-methyltransferase [Pseudobacteriovorax antillogorgiicola]TCS54680.1 methionine synthase (B12-independent) [Pseudobacteriovorax antillogorgiicola]SMF16598.1 methionine synthase (B12-independent) [Pseudobacteriovorax antillogorgiicola]